MDEGGAKLLKLIRDATRDESADLSLESLARYIGWSPFHLQRRFKKLTGETPKRFIQRIRLERAASNLLRDDASVLEIALDAGFESHEVFTRAFTRHFGCVPSAIREKKWLAPEERERQREIVRSVGPCLGLYRMPGTADKRRTSMPMSTIERKVLGSAQPILFIRRRIPFNDLQQTMGECFGKLYTHGAKSGLAIAGHPLARFVSTGTGLWTVDFGMPLMAESEGSGEMQAGSLFAGPVAFAVHEGPYEGLPQTNAAIQNWIEDNGHEAADAPWESYVTDPGEFPNPADWRTEVYWPLKD